MPFAETWTVGRLLQWTTDYLQAHGSESARLDAEVLLAEALSCQRIDLYTRFDEPVGEDDRAKFRELVRRRAEGMPVAYLVGRREFYSLVFRVTPDVLIPRPETELLVVAALDLAKGAVGRCLGAETSGQLTAPSPESRVPSPKSQMPKQPINQLSIADVGVGSGVIAVCLAKHMPNCRVTAVDISPAALDVARENARQHGVAERIDFYQSDLFAKVPAERQFDFVVSNPPYVMESEMDRLPRDVRQFEPKMALLAGPKGTEVIERLIAQSVERLRPGGWLLMEVSPTIHTAVEKLFNGESRFALGPTIKDLARLPRVIQARRSDEGTGGGD